MLVVEEPAAWTFNMSVYLLSITLGNFVITHPYKFAFKETCQKVGKQVVENKKSWKYRCVFIKKLALK